MITSRYLHPDDYLLLVTSLAADEYHLMVPMFFVEPETITLVYEDERSPVLFLRGKGFEQSDGNSLQVDIQFVNNNDVRRNLKTLLEGFPDLCQKAKVNGFSRIHFTVSGESLRKFCIRRFGFKDIGDSLLIKEL
jgi:hypothetical protein